MRRKAYIAISLGLLLTLGGCSKVVKTDICSDQGTNFSTYKTFAFLDQTGKPARLDDPFAKSPDSRQVVKQMVEQKLTEMGLTRDRINDADFLVAIYAGDDDQLRPEMQRWRYSFGQHWFFEDDRSYPKGALILDFFDAEDNRLFWRGAIFGIVRSDGGLTGKVGTAIPQLLDSYPPDFTPYKSPF